MDNEQFDSFIEESIGYLNLKWQELGRTELQEEELVDLSDRLDDFFGDIVEDEEG